MLEDYILIHKIKRGDTDAWEKLVKKYYDGIYCYCVRRCYGNRILATDLTQDIFVKLIENIYHYRYSGKLYNYLFTIAVNTCHNYYKKKQIDQIELNEQQLISNRETPINHLEIQVEQQLIQEALDKLPTHQREAIILKYYHGLKVKDIAKISGVGLSTAQSRIYQGLKKLEKLLDREDFLNDKRG